MTKITLAIFLCLVGRAYAQSGEVTNAILALKDGMVADAKTSIDKASVHEKTAAEPKTWLYVGKVYEAVALDQNLSKQFPDAAKKSYEGYQKALQLDATSAKPGKFKKDIEEALNSPNLAIAIQNAGIQAYNSKRLMDSHDYFVMYQGLRPKDTLGYVYAAQMALAADNYPKAKISYLNSVEKNGYYTPEILSNLLYILKNVESERDYNKALEIAQLGRNKYPNNTAFVLHENDLLEKTGKLDLAIANQEKLVASPSATAESCVVLGSLYEKNKNTEKAKQAYAKALDKNPSSFEANYNMGALIYNPAVDIIKEVRNMGAADYKKKGAQMESNAKEILKQALPYFERANAAKPQDEQTKKTLRELYMNLGMNDKAAGLK